MRAPGPAAARSLTELGQVSGPRWDPPLDTDGLPGPVVRGRRLVRRATHAALPGYDQSCLALLDEARTGGAAVLTDGAILAGGDEADGYAADAADIVKRWDAAGRPPMQAWRVTLALAGDPESPIWVPANWQL